MIIYKFRNAIAAAAILLPMLGVGIAGCSDKHAEETTATATSAGKAGAPSSPQQPSEQGKAAESGAGNQVPKPLTPPP
jgi:hypothetical protein